MEGLLVDYNDSVSQPDSSSGVPEIVQSMFYCCEFGSGDISLNESLVCR